MVAVATKSREKKSKVIFSQKSVKIDLILRIE